MSPIKITMWSLVISGILFIILGAYNFAAVPDHGSYKLFFTIGMMLFGVFLLVYFLGYQKGRKIRKLQG
jgi:uncharacterized membrane protein